MHFCCQMCDIANFRVYYLYARNRLRSHTTLGLHTLGRTSNPLTFKGFTLSRSTPIVVFSVTYYLDLCCVVSFFYKSIFLILTKVESEVVHKL